VLLDINDLGTSCVAVSITIACFADWQMRKSHLEVWDMEISEARWFANKTVDLTWLDRLGNELSATAQVFEVTFVPLYGPSLITTAGDIRLDRIVSCKLSESMQEATAG